MILKPEQDYEVCGVPGRLKQVSAYNNHPHLLAQQVWVSEARRKGQLQFNVKIRFDDSLKNGVNDFAIVGEGRDEYGELVEGGTMHKDVAKYFPELAHLIKWHLCSTKGPMHYIGNTTYHAGNRDCHGLLNGEERQIVNGRTGGPCWRTAVLDSSGKEVRLPDYADSLVQPAMEYTLAWRPWNRVGEGKERDLDAARECAAWPEATDEQLMLPKEQLTKLLEARLPQLLVDFRTDIEAAGLLWLEPK